MPNTHTITLKNFKHAAFASEETYCFQATVYINGSKAGLASNSGHGGPTDFHPTNGVQYTREEESLIEDAIDTEVHKLVCEKQDKAILASVKRDLSKNLLFRRNDTKPGEMRIIKGIVGTPAYETKVAALKADPTVVAIFNTMSLEQAAKAMYPHYKTLG